MNSINSETSYFFVLFKRFFIHNTFIDIGSSQTIDSVISSPLDLEVLFVVSLASDIGVNYVLKFKYPFPFE